MVQETIEIGAVEVDRYGQLHGRFSRLIKPELHPQLSHFCRRLTQIDQVDINRARSFDRVIHEFQDWIGVGDDEYLLASWGGFDKTQLVRDCRLHDEEEWWLEDHIDLKAQYRQIRKLPKKRGLKSAVRHEGYEWEGEQHRALVDAVNTAKIFVGMIDVWQY